MRYEPVKPNRDNRIKIQCSYCEKSDREERMKANLDKTWDYICAECEDLLAEYYNA